MSEKRTVRISISLDILTLKSIEDIKAALNKGIYRGLDSPPYYIAQPKDVIINSLQEVYVFQDKDLNINFSGKLE